MRTFRTVVEREKTGIAEWRGAKKKKENEEQLGGASGCIGTPRLEGGGPLGGFLEVKGGSALGGRRGGRETRMTRRGPQKSIAPATARIGSNKKCQNEQLNKQTKYFL